MDYTSVKYINPIGGLMVERNDGVFFYCPPDTEEHAAIVAHFGDAIEAYVDDDPPESESDESDAPEAEAS